jgi:hypothetical protein
MTAEDSNYAHPDTRVALASSQIIAEPVHSLDLHSLPTEVLQMIVDYTIQVTKSLQSVRAVCKLLEALSNRHFRKSHLTHLSIAPACEAFTRLSWTARIPELAVNIQSSTVNYDNQNPSLSGALCPGMWAKDKADLLLRALHHLHRNSKQINLIFRVAKTPLDGKASIISIMYQILIYVLFYHGGYGVQKVFLDFDDTTSRAYPVIGTLPNTRASTKNYGPGYRHIWAHMMQSRVLAEIRIRFSKKDEQTDSSRYLAIERCQEGIHVRMERL